MHKQASPQSRSEKLLGHWVSEFAGLEHWTTGRPFLGVKGCTYRHVLSCICTNLIVTAPIFGVAATVVHGLKLAESKQTIRLSTRAMRDDQGLVNPRLYLRVSALQLA